MTDKQQQPEALELASVAESADLVGYPTAKKANAYCLCLLEDCAQMIRRLHAENEALRAGYAAARLEIESLKAQLAEHASHGQAPAQAASSAVLKAIREANMQLVRTGDDAFMLVPYKVATAQAAESVPAPPPPPECETEAEKRAFAFGWFKAQEADCAARAPADSVLEDAIKVLRADLKTSAKEIADEYAEDAARWRDWSQAFAEASAAPEDTVFMKAFEDAIGDSDAPFTAEQFTSWVDAARKQGGAT